MPRFLIPLSLLATAFISAPFASASDAGKIAVEPGLWNWSHETLLASFPFKEENTECLPSEQASFSLQDMADHLGQDCSVSSMSERPDGYDFTLSCSGFYSGTAKGSFLRQSDESLAMNAAGMVDVGGVTADFSFKAKAERVGECRG